MQERWAALEAKLLARGLVVRVNEVWRSGARQQWLYGAGRTVEEMQAVAAPLAFARPHLAKVTNAWSAKTTAHGYLLNGIPAACALDVVPVGPDGIPWNADDPWGLFVKLTELFAAEVGLRHFRDAHGCITDRPHLQLVEWSDMHRDLILPQPPHTPPLAA